MPQSKGTWEMKSTGVSPPGTEQEGMDLEGPGGMGEMQASKKRRMKSSKADYDMCFMYSISFNPPRMF